MQQPKSKYEVYRIDIQIYDDYDVREIKTYEGITYATSEARAINNIKYRNRIKPSDLYCDYGGDAYSRDTYFVATKI